MSIQATEKTVCIRLARLLVLGFFALTAPLSMAIAPGTFALPNGCTNATGSAYNGDLLYDGEPPIVTLSFNNGSQTTYLDTNVTFQNAQQKWAFEIPGAPNQVVFVQVAFTPFLYQYWTQKGTTETQTLTVPEPNGGVAAQYRVWPVAHIRLYTDATNTTPMPGGFLLMASQSILGPTIADPPPYAVQADQNGWVTISCFTALRNGNSGTVVSPNGANAYDMLYPLYATGTYQ